MKDYENLWLANYIGKNHASTHHHAIGLILAFYQHIAQIYADVSDDTIGQMRLTWWRDSIIADNANTDIAKNHTLLSAHKPTNISDLLAQLHQMMAEYHLPSCYFEGLIEARMQEFTALPFADIKQFQHYCGTLSGNLFALWAVLIKKDDMLRDDKIRELFFQASEIYTFSRVIRSLHWQAKQGLLFLPQNILNAHGLDAYQPAQALQSAQMKEIIAIMAQDAVARHHDALIQLQDNSEMRALCRDIEPLFAFSTIAQKSLKHFAKYDYDYLNPRALAPPPLLSLQLRFRRKIF
ncbi:MAG: squalene/phytoene synthase family protein [Alphaproteobacteria bacterium]|nr:squalene/phytoene synthase family protein [Alphaproteobacteria bacterium]